MIGKAIVVINILDKALAKNEVSKQLDIQTNAIIHHINNQKIVAIKKLESIRLELDMIAKKNKNYFEQEAMKIIIKENHSKLISQIISNLLTLKEYDKALEIAKLKPSIIEQNTIKLLN